MTHIIATFDKFMTSKKDEQYFWFYDETVAGKNYCPENDKKDFEMLYLGNDLIMKDMFQFINIRNIPANTPYCVYVKATIGNDDITPPPPNRNVILEIKRKETIRALGYDNSTPYNDYHRVINDSRRGLVDWFIDDVAEVFIDELSADKEFMEIIGIADRPEKLHLLTGVYRNKLVEDTEQKTGVKIHSANPFEKWAGHNAKYMASNTTVEKTKVFLQQTITDIESYAVRPHSSLIYNRVPRASRALLLDNMKQNGNLKTSLYSWGIDFLRLQHKNNQDSLNRFITKHSVWNNSIDDAGVKKLHDIFDTWYGPDVEPMYFPDEIGKITLTQNQAHGVNLVHPRLCDFKIVTETIYSPYTFLTEKTFKAYRTLMPFVVFANPETIKSLRELGYRTYDKWIDHSYDKVSEFTPRLDLLSKEIDRLTKITSTDWAQMRKEMLPDIIYNYQHLLNNFNRSYGHVWFE